MATLSRTISSPRALLMFEAAARHGSFTAAAAEFNITQPSISRSIAQLEVELGFRLFQRQSRGLLATREGKLLFESVQESMTSVSRTIEEIRKNFRQRSVTMSMSSSFATHWLIPRLGDFNDAFPDIDLRFELVSGVMRDITHDVDIATRIVEDDDPRYDSWDFAPEVILAVCSAGYLSQHGSLDDAETLSRHIFLHLTDHKRDQWKPFVASAVLDAPDVGTWNQFSDYGVILQAATQGKGVALGWISVIASALNEKTLVAASSKHRATGRLHRLIIPKNRPVPEGTREICEWLQREMSSDLKKFSI